MRLLGLSLPVMLDKIMDRSGSAVPDEAINLLHKEIFNLAVLKEMIKNIGDCQAITQVVIGP